MEEEESEELPQSVEPTYVDLYVAAVAQDDEQALEDLLQFAALFRQVENDEQET